MLKQLDKESVQSTAQVMLTYLDDPANKTPNNMLEGIVSGKGMLRGLINGNLVLCQIEVAPPKKPAPPADEADSPQE